MSEAENRYWIEADNVKAEVEIRIFPKEFAALYLLKIPEVEAGTSALLEKIRETLIGKVAIKTIETFEPRQYEEMKTKFLNTASEFIRSELKDVSEDVIKLLSGILVHDMLGIGKIEFLIADPNLEEIVINNSQEPVWVYHKKYGWLKTNIKIPREVDVENYASIAARRVGKEITNLHPLLDAHLITGDRVNATLFPISTKGNTLTIRKFRRNPWVMPELISGKTISLDVAALLWTAMEYEINILISGGTASGKTTFLNVLTTFIPPNQRIISLEDTREIKLPSFLHWVPLTTRTPNPEGLGGIDMLELLINSLRMRPDRIIVGEIRRHDQAEVLFEAMHMGHSVYATLHADTAEQTYRRLTSPPINLPDSMLESLQLIVAMFRDRRRGIRRIFQVAEIVPVEGAETKVMLNTLYRWSPVKDEIEKQEKSLRVVDELKLRAGMSEKEFEADLEDKKNILAWMVDHKIGTVDGVGKVVYEYYYDPENVIKIVNKNKSPEEIIPKELLDGAT